MGKPKIPMGLGLTGRLPWGKFSEYTAKRLSATQGKKSAICGIYSNSKPNLLKIVTTNDPSAMIATDRHLLSSGIIKST